MSERYLFTLEHDFRTSVPLNMELSVAIVNGLQLVAFNHCHKDLFLRCCRCPTSGYYICFAWDITFK